MLTPEEILEYLPQKHPFRFLDKLHVVNREQAIGTYTFREDEFFYRGHFPGDPVTPGVILLETMCQTGLVALGMFLLSLEDPESVAHTITLFTDAKVDFARLVRPLDTVRVEAKAVFWRRKKLQSEVRLLLADGSVAASGVVSGIGVKRHVRA